MNLKQCLKILELENPGSIQDAKRAYKDLVRVWHPDRFQSNPRLKQKAEQKLRAINLAFNFLRDYMESDHAGGTAVSQIPPGNSPSGQKAADDAARSVRHKPDTNNPAMARPHISMQTSSASAGRKIVPRTSSIGRYVLLAVFLIVVSISALIVYFLSNTDEIASKSRGIASEAMENILDKLEQDGTIQKNDASAKRLIQDLEKETRAQKSKLKFEIHLDSSSIILTEMWWEEGDMIMYQVDGGTMGIERSRVKKIIKR